MNRRLIIVLALVLVIVGGAIAFVVLGNSGGGASSSGGSSGGGNSVAAQPTASGPTDTPEPTITPIPFIEIVIAVQEIPRGIAIPPNAVAVRRFPEESAPFQAYSNVEDVIGKIARTDIYREQPIQRNLLVEDLTALADVGSDAAAILPPNRVAVSIPIDRITSVAYAIQPGDRVDVMVSVLFVDVDPNFQSLEPNAFTFINPSDNGDGTFSLNASEAGAIAGAFDTRLVPNLGSVPVIIVPSERQRPRLTTQRTVQDALVIWTGDFPLNGRIFRPAPTPTPLPPTAAPGATAGATNTAPPAPTIPPRPDIITVAVTPQDAVVLTWLVEAGIPITFALRSASSTSQVQTDPVSLDYIMTRFNIDVPEKFNYNIEPAIRSIRQLSVGNQIELRD
jgi:Flp pilus assembly protein CpaB